MNVRLRKSARLDGLPLAIELAAVRMRLFSPQTLLARLKKQQVSLNLLVGGARDVLERHQTLRKAINWSYELLNDEERRAFRVTSIFVGGFSLDAAGMAISCRSSGQPASSSSTRIDGFSVSRFASTQPAEPAPMMM